MLRNLSGRVRDHSTFRGQLLALLSSAVVLEVNWKEMRDDSGLVALLHHVATHGLAHHTNADKTDTCILRIHSAY